MPRIAIEEEVEEPRGWAFVVRISDDAGEGSERMRVRLDWSDYELWSRGRVAPSRVAEALVRFLVERSGPGAVRDSFDAARVRRDHPDVDAALPGLL